ncbi:ROK family transcriptional regulator [Metabacillus litoralis]|uniref:ROK family transcriptional regulator n=1 Tax=Metabacillus litoralis TaxID=152268 RepID=UPI001CFF4378|nr:ROK family transcriptional regulator [Metabacillus litoralis]
MKENRNFPKNNINREIRSSLIDLGSATKVELSERLEISFPTINKFLKKMESNGEIMLVGLDDSSGGRRANRYAYRADYMLGLAIFLESNETNYVVFNCFGEVKDQGKIQSVLKDKDVLRLLLEIIEDKVAKYPNLRSIAIGVPGAVENGRIFYIPGYEHLQNFDLKKHLEEHFEITVVIENDMNAAVLGYHYKMNIKNNQSLIYLYSGQNGPGAGIMVNGDVVRGSTFFSGEVSFIPQYNDQNFLTALGNDFKKKSFNEHNEIDAVSRLVAAFVAIINPHTFIFCHDEATLDIIERIAKKSSTYIPAEHLPQLTVSDWKQDYLYGLQHLCLEQMISTTE